MIAERTKWCPRCDEWKSEADDFYVRKRWPDGTARYYKSYCKSCDNKARKEWEQANPDKAAAWARNASLKRRRDPERGDIRRTYEREYQRRLRRAAGVPPRRFRGGHVERRTGELLDARPFAEWLRYLMRRDDLDKSALAVVLDIPLETLRRCLNARQDTVDLGTVEAALCRDGSRSLQDLYPDAMTVAGQNHAPVVEGLDA